MSESKQPSNLLKSVIAIIILILVIIIAKSLLPNKNKSQLQQNIQTEQNAADIDSTPTSEITDVTRQSSPETPKITNEEVPSDVTLKAKSDPLAVGTFTEYDESLLSNANSGDVLIFFHATWCPSCRGLEKDINSNLSNIPTDMTILKADYDSETTLKKKYGVVRQHTIVQVDANGDEIKTLTGITNTLEQVIRQI